MRPSHSIGANTGGDRLADVLSVGDEKGAEDELVVREAREEDRTIMTCDKDFGFSALPHGPPGISKIYKLSMRHGFSGMSMPEEHFKGALIHLLGGIALTAALVIAFGRYFLSVLASLLLVGIYTSIHLWYYVMGMFSEDEAERGFNLTMASATALCVLAISVLAALSLSLSYFLDIVGAIYSVYDANIVITRMLFLFAILLGIVLWRFRARLRRGPGP